MFVLRTKFGLTLLLLALAGWVAPGVARRAPAPVPVRIIAFNDFHGALQPPGQGIATDGPDGRDLWVPAGGAAYLATALRQLRRGHPNTLTVAAGDLIGASPLASALYLDEPTILTLNRVGLEYSAVGNHEFDRGRAELLRMQNGGCAQHTRRTPCAVDRDFPGARFRYLAANVRTEDGSTLFPAYAIHHFGRGARRVTVGIIGLTLRDTATLVPPDGITGLTFADEADSINALVPRLRAEGADAIVVLIHQGVDTSRRFDAEACPGATGGLLPILARLDPRVDIVVAGHVHRASLCDYGGIDPTRPFLVTNAERNGEILTAIDLAIDPATHRVVSRRANQTIVQGEAYQSRQGPVPLVAGRPRFAPDPVIAALVRRYVDASAATFGRPIGRLQRPASKTRNAAGESELGDLISDAYLAATRAPADGGAQIALINETSVRTDLIPAANGELNFGQLFSAQPFGNTLVVKSFTGRELRAILEQQFDSGSNSAAHPIMLTPSAGFTFSYDLGRPAGQRIVEMQLDGQPIADDRVYRVAMNSFLSAGGDNFTLFREGRDPVDHAILDLDALERYIAANSPLAPPVPNRITRLGAPR